MAICIRAKSEILSISRDLREGNIPDEEQKSVLRAQLKDLEKWVKKGEQAIGESEYHPQTTTYMERSLYLPIPLGGKSNRPEAPAAVASKGTGETRQLAALLGPPKESIADALEMLK